MRASRLRLPESAATIGLGCRNAVDDLTFEDFPPGRFGTFGPPGIAHFGIAGLVTANQGYRIVSLFDRMHGCVERFFANAF